MGVISNPSDHADGECGENGVHDNDEAGDSVCDDKRKVCIEVVIFADWLFFTAVFLVCWFPIGSLLVTEALKIASVLGFLVISFKRGISLIVVDCKLFQSISIGIVEWVTASWDWVLCIHLSLLLAAVEHSTE